MGSGRRGGGGGLVKLRGEGWWGLRRWRGWIFGGGGGGRWLGRLSAGTCSLLMCSFLMCGGVIGRGLAILSAAHRREERNEEA